MHHSSILNHMPDLTRKTQWDKTIGKEKRVQNVFISSPHVDNHI